MVQWVTRRDMPLFLQTKPAYILTWASLRHFTTAPRDRDEIVESFYCERAAYHEADLI